MNIFIRWLSQIDAIVTEAGQHTEAHTDRETSKGCLRMCAFTYKDFECLILPEYKVGLRQLSLRYMRPCAHPRPPFTHQRAKKQRKEEKKMQETCSSSPPPCVAACSEWNTLFVHTGSRTRQKPGFSTYCFPQTRRNSQAVQESARRYFREALLACSGCTGRGCIARRLCLAPRSQMPKGQSVATQYHELRRPTETNTLPCLHPEGPHCAVHNAVWVTQWKIFRQEKAASIFKIMKF